MKLSIETQKLRLVGQTSASVVIIRIKKENLKEEGFVCTNS
ncbi:hypothetical protein VIBNISO65_1170015 [Vibrio nigripulchritudo SO65]|nr:hypothetical protein VIBNIFTn2_930014 [Vibrio nigripulchritudo FTn2]CCN74790.1 hypothetical protein VIBNISO65_1170015 [Vibrio nigripulchritudo SO65]